MTDLIDKALSRRPLLLVVLLVTAAAIPRLYNLGEQGFYGDEETTAFAAIALLEGRGAQMPSGMPYRRALPHTWLNAISARLFGAENEISYRIPAAIFGILTVPLIFFLARSSLGIPMAFLAALLLAFSEWHIITSRTARMYAPFLFFYIASASSILQWAKRGDLKFFLIATLSFILAVSFQSLGVFIAFIPLIALFIKGYTRTPYYKLIAFSIIGGIAAYIYGQLFVGAPYQSWKETHGIISSNSDSANSITQLLVTNNLLSVPALIGIFLGIWLARNSTFVDTENGEEFRLVTRYLLAISFGWLSAGGHLHGAFLSILLLLLLYPESLFAYIKQAYKPLLAIAILAIISVTVTFANQGYVSGIKASLSFPYPYWILFAKISPGITILFLSSLALLALRKKNINDHATIAIGICGLFPLVIVGIAMKWAPARYLITAYPFILITSVFMLGHITTRTAGYFYSKPKKVATFASYLIGLLGVLGGHGILQAYNAGTITHGDSFNEATISLPLYPDHKFPGEFVAANRETGDLVVAEDTLQQRWYAGEIDYWLRHYDNDSDFLYKGNDQLLHDIYIDSIAMTPEVLKFLTNNTSRRIWIITSGETYSARDYYLTKEQRHWLEAIENTIAPVFIGKDNITKVYCLHCATAD